MRLKILTYNIHKGFDIFNRRFVLGRIKQSITGSGSASKEQVAAMLQKLLNINELPKYLDATDGLAVAVCHHFSKGIGAHNVSKGGSWKAFINADPKRVKK